MQIYDDHLLSNAMTTSGRSPCKFGVGGTVDYQGLMAITCALDY